MTPARDIGRLIEIMAALRTPTTGCPWDLEQSFATIAPYTLEEAYEVADAIARNDLADLKDELGDLLLQVVFHARMAEEQGSFDFGDVVEAITTKLIRRHPHVFGDERAESPAAVKGLWEEIAFGDVYSAQTYSPSHGQDLYRRSMYTFWKRTSPPPALITFDAPDREKCTARRAVTNTPLQALVLLNDPTYVEAARALAEKMMHEGGSDAAHRIRYAFRLATAREPDAKEVQVLREMERAELAQYRHDPEGAQKLVGVGESKADPKLDAGELAAWTTVASTILNLDETITRE